METILDSPRAVAAAANELIDAQLRHGTMVRFTVPTWSMLPALAPGDRVTVRALRGNEPRVGDIVLIHSDPNWLAHRFIERRMQDGKVSFVTKGDNSPEPDSVWSREQIRGIIIAVEHNGSTANLQSRRARAAGAIIAYLSRFRSRFAGKRPNILSKIGGRVVRAGTFVAQRIAGSRATAHPCEGSSGVLVRNALSDAKNFHFRKRFRNLRKDG